MIDPKLLRSSPDDVAGNLARRNFDFDVAAYAALEERRKSVQIEVENLRSERNSRSKNIGKAKAGGEDIAPLLAAVEDLGARLETAGNELEGVQAELNEVELGLPNLLHDDVPVGVDEADNVEIHRWGEPRQFDFAPLDHVELGANLGMLDFEAAAKISGSRFAIMQGPLARLQRALIQLMLDTHTGDHGYKEVYVPYIVKSEALIGTGQLPKFE
ncbi:MAG: serine--tRNA ligase, partial [Woeseiaceae bacterium]|nr:serine--tRNA ligase [Woeseiaceae bacterium]